MADRPAWALATMADRHAISWAGAGWLEGVVAKGIAAVDAAMSLAVPPARRVVVSCGGYPNDETLYTAQRALELTRAAYAPGAEVLFLAECRHGIAGTETAKRNFYDRLTAPLPEVLRTIEEEYLLYAHKAYKLATLLQETRRVWLHSSLPSEAVEAAHLAPAPEPQRVLDAWLAEAPEEGILVFDKANKLAIR
jgi:nickel-dependent lactate racemase